MVWKIEYADAARRQLKKLNPSQAKQIIDYMDHRVAVAKDPRQSGHGLIGNRAGYWRYRVADMRIICEIRDDRFIILVVKIGNRRDVYK